MSYNFITGSKSFSNVSGGEAVGSSGFVFSRLLDGGSDNMLVDGTTPVDFEYEVAAGKSLTLQAIFIYLQGPNAFTSDQFGSDALGLTNGCELLIGDAGAILFKNNLEISTIFKIETSRPLGLNQLHILGRVEFINPIIVPENKKVIFRIQDDLSVSTNEVFISGIYGLLNDK